MKKIINCEHPEVLREYNKETGVNVSLGQPRYWKCQKCGKRSESIKDFKK
jgi:tRNA(Ile2) C34 agmatinyltransferase TiaS